MLDACIFRHHVPHGAAFQLHQQCTRMYIEFSLRPSFAIHVMHMNLPGTTRRFVTRHNRYTIKSSDAGVGVSYSPMRRVVSLERVADAYAADLSVSAKEGVTARHIVK